MHSRRPIRAALAAVVVVVAACGNTASPSPVGSPSRGGPNDVAVKLTTVVEGLSNPLYVTGAGDRSGRLFVVEQPGQIRIVRNESLAATPFLDIGARITSGDERGLLGLAFHPRFGTDEPRFYVDYTDTSGDTVIVEYRVSRDDPDVADPDSERVLLTIAQPFANHNGGMLAFGPDGWLYVGMGDGGSGGDPQGNGQNVKALLGKILRLDVDHPAGDKLYGTDGNPLVGKADARPEIWALGVRNAWRFSFDRLTDDLWIGDVGQNAWEEVDRATAASGGGAGANFGWNVMEGRHCFEPSSGCDRTGLALPIAEYSHDAGCSITGGYVSRGASSPALAGVYVFSDYCTGTIWGLDSGGPDEQEPVILAASQRSVSSFGEDDDANLYVTDIAKGELLRVVGQPR